MKRIKTDYLVIGSGIAGLTFALKVANQGLVAVLTKKSAEDSNTRYAQGGIAAVISDKDHFEYHINDTLKAGADLCHEDAVRVLVTEGPNRIKDLMAWGVNFTRDESKKLDLAREGGHRMKRIVHVSDMTGDEIEKILLEKAKSHPNIQIFENYTAIDLITEHQVLDNLQSAFNICFGVYALNNIKGEVEAFRADYTMLACGGACQVYLHTTNPEIATGDGIAIAYRAGAKIANMEFIQFHPTALYDPEHEPFLISEALRGYGGILRNSQGEQFMERYDPAKELAPRDIVARAIDSEMKKNGEKCVFLDMTGLPAAEVKKRFPTIYAHCKKTLNLDITKELIPVVPAAHYLCGGIMTNLSGQTSMHNLLASGENTHTGVHGANRLASNSLLEALVFSHRAALKVLQKPKPHFQITIPDWDDSGVVNEEEWGVIRHNRHEIQTIMWNYVGIVRSKNYLFRAMRRINLLYDEIEDYYKRTRVSKGLLELRNLTTVAYLITRSALRREESRGLHYRTDFPDKSEKFRKDTVI
ncbi:MAG: L-aspartate oxidase [Candidatus Marinimicrobia bacterium]|nr:L-aspartate oxidase [Candidatus Neomarinimicrobiota bacterium]MDD5582352.1 L-aspartate oxidase [Candidatus Neomarinimicrobiota bacterium]